MADTDATAALAAQAHRAISEGAETSKRAIAAHRRALRAQRQALDKLERTCNELGIRLVTDDDERTN
ncbi:MAG: hypothetical protein ACRDNE_00650 [Gaiellaceae bacterium]